MLTKIKGANPFWGHFNAILKEQTGAPQERWIEEVPNEGLIHYRTLFNEGRVIPTTPKALSEVLVQKNYEFVKPLQVRAGVGRLLGVGILLAEGEEHRIQRKNLMVGLSRALLTLLEDFRWLLIQRPCLIYRHLPGCRYTDTVL